MARIPEVEIERLKNEISVERLVQNCNEDDDRQKAWP